MDTTPSKILANSASKPEYAIKEKPGKFMEGQN
jgi:hypothetical protein